MEARQHKPTGGLMGEEIAVFAPKEEWADILRFIKESPYWPPVNDPVIDFILELHERGVRE